MRVPFEITASSVVIRDASGSGYNNQDVDQMPGGHSRDDDIDDDMEDVTISPKKFQPQIRKDYID